MKPTPPTCRRTSSVLLCAIALLSSLLGLTAARADEIDDALASIRPESLRAGMRFLSSDALEGRGTGARGHEIAAEYLASQFEALGLKPSGDAGTYLQSVPIRAMQLDEAASGAMLLQPAAAPLVFEQDVLLSPDPGRDRVEVEAPIVFAGFGVSAPDQKYDDYRHLDVKGKIVAVMYGAPNFPAAVKAHYSASWLKRRTAAQHGAVGFLVLYDPRLEKMYPFQEQVRDLAIRKLRWLSPDGTPNDYQGALQVVGTLSMQGTRRLLAASPTKADALFAATKAGHPPAFATGASARFRTVTRHEDITSPNVVALLEGSDPTLKNEYVVLSAHLDHLGISTPVNGDAIYNGALDNASGSAILVEVARALSGLRVKPKRSLLFVAVTGEEAGLIGSGYYANHPAVPVSQLVANINMDEDMMLWPLRDVIALGAEHSSLGDVVARAGAHLGLTSSPDPNPEQVYFIRSDQYSFVRQGIPSFGLMAGLKSEDPAIDPKAISDRWEETTYHHPSDDMQQPGLDFASGAQFVRVLLLCTLFTANDPSAPRWNPGDFFGTAFPLAR